MTGKLNSETSGVFHSFDLLDNLRRIYVKSKVDSANPITFLTETYDEQKDTDKAMAMEMHFGRKKQAIKQLIQTREMNLNNRG